VERAREWRDLSLGVCMSAEPDVPSRFLALAPAACSGGTEGCKGGEAEGREEGDKWRATCVSSTY
jgi:hypothetical protein